MRKRKVKKEEKVYNYVNIDNIVYIYINIFAWNNKERKLNPRREFSVIS